MRGYDPEMRASDNDVPLWLGIADGALLFDAEFLQGEPSVMLEVAERSGERFHAGHGQDRAGRGALIITTALDEQRALTCFIQVREAVLRSGSTGHGADRRSPIRERED